MVRIHTRETQNYVARFQFYRRVLLLEDEALALGQDVKQYHAFRMLAE